MQAHTAPSSSRERGDALVWSAAACPLGDAPLDAYLAEAMPHCRPAGAAPTRSRSALRRSPGPRTGRLTARLSPAVGGQATLVTADSPRATARAAAGDHTPAEMALHVLAEAGYDADEALRRFQAMDGAGSRLGLWSKAAPPVQAEPGHARPARAPAPPPPGGPTAAQRALTQGTDP